MQLVKKQKTCERHRSYKFRADLLWEHSVRKLVNVLFILLQTITFCRARGYVCQHGNRDTINMLIHAMIERDGRLISFFVSVC